MNTLRRRLRMVVVCCSLAGLMLYVLYQARAYIRGPRLTIDSASREGPLLAVAGTAEHISFLSLNGKQIYTDEKGRWQERVLLLPGYTIITLAAKDRFGRKADMHRDFYRAEDKGNF